ncbi:MAG: HPr-rel-A system PqqD family peptide chaperone [Pseudomonadota bacterium]|nr:HPr-rel-A system PqqD family peptide chaperone [Pseudomonadota bacterium]
MAGPSYIADDQSQIRKVELDGLTALFHVPSGMTHIVAPPAPQILEALAGRPADLRELVRRLSRNFDVDGAESALAARLDELEAAGLVSRL